MNSQRQSILTILLIAILVVSAIGTFAIVGSIDNFSDAARFTGLWDSDGISQRAAVNLTILSFLIINFTDNAVDFGTGYVNKSYQACTMGTDGTYSAGCVGFNQTTGLLLENLGSKHAKINISNVNYTNSLLGGTRSGYAWMWSSVENDASTCYGGNLDSAKGNWVNITSPYQKNTASLCNFFNYTTGSDLINFSFKFHIHKTALARLVSDYWLITALDANVY